MAQQIPVDPGAQAPFAAPDDPVHEIRLDLAYRRLAMVNVEFVGAAQAGTGRWVLVDAGLPGMSGMIIRSAESRFGQNAPPSAIVLTHGHFDHVGSLRSLADHWDVPIYAHVMEHPYLNGTASYPPPDPTVGGGTMSWSASLLPRGPIDVRNRLHTLPGDGSVPGIPGWTWLHTPGHAPGHVSFWREADRSLIVGDAFITTAQESAYAVATQEPELNGPPKYYTPDWEAAADSVRRLAELEPELVIAGHGRAMRGPAMRVALHKLAKGFEHVAVPVRGRYVGGHPAREGGGAYR